jgi:glutaredoxin
MLLTRRGAKVEEVLVCRDAAKLNEMVQRSGQRSVPQIFVDDMLVGGFKDYAHWMTAAHWTNFSRTMWFVSFN